MMNIVEDDTSYDGCEELDRPQRRKAEKERLSKRKNKAHIDSGTDRAGPGARPPRQLPRPPTQQGTLRTIYSVDFNKMYGVMPVLGTDSSLRTVLEEMIEENKQMNEKKIEMYQKTYMQEQERSASNTISRLRREDGSLCSDPDEIKALIVQFYQNLLNRDSSFDMQLPPPPGSVSADENSTLCSPILEKELRDTTKHTATSLSQLFSSFAASSGLYLNTAKSQIFAPYNPMAQDFCTEMDISQHALPVRYLGLPLLNCALKYSHCISLVDKPPRWPTSLDGLWNNISELDVGGVGEDVLIWSPSKFGDLTLSSAWNFLRPALPSSPMWSTWVWLSSQTPRHSLCLWQAFQDKLPTRTRLLRKGLISNASCLLCRSGTEDADHLFLNCSFSRYIFRALMKGLLIASPIPRSFENLPQWLTTSVACPIKKSLIQISLSIFCWHVWMERNSRIFSGKSNHKGLLLRQIKADITRRCCSLSLKAVRSPDILKLGWIKLNSDGSLSEDRGGYGALLRTHEADFIYGIAGRIDLPSINLLELKAIEEGLWLAIRLNFPSIWIETDSTTACAWVLGKARGVTIIPPSQLWHELRTTIELDKNEKVWTFVSDEKDFNTRSNEAFEALDLDSTASSHGRSYAGRARHCLFETHFDEDVAPRLGVGHV
ncbi:hypothetical protein QJS10_CPA01g01609 [Acorus calamus]|uniref:Reverse transcriptase zinc-binding domain-containing protein n=1 Tax=Acorus calamus TaxID=4465 RepID=A0AAV9FKE8_ACOCL|nr:hypothetical protein QJS10_CPA01g01609 [Acorus calamus]